MLNLYSFVRNNPLALTDPSGMEIYFDCSQVSAAQCNQTVADLNSRYKGQFSLSRNARTGKLSVSGNVDRTTLSVAERALYDAVNDKNVAGILHVLGNDSSMDFEANDEAGHNSLDRSDLNVLRGADKRLPGELIAHAALEAYGSAANGGDVEAAHQSVNVLFGDVNIYGPHTLDSPRGGIGGLVYYYEFHRLNINAFVVRSFQTPIPLQALPRGNTPRFVPGDITKVQKDTKP